MESRRREFRSCVSFVIIVLSDVLVTGLDGLHRLKVIDHFVTLGSHFVECELLGEEGRGVPMFKILGIFST